MKPRTVLAGVGFLLGCLALGGALAQEPPPAEEPAPAEAPAEPEAEGPAASEKEKLPFALYVEAGWGSGSADEINSSIETSATSKAQSLLEIDEQDYTRAAVGWKLPHGKGDFRLVFNGFNEAGYQFQSLGRFAGITNPGTGAAFDGNPVWWNILIDDGNATALRTPPSWTAADDDDGDGLIDPSEVTYGPADRTIVGRTADSLQHQVQTWDAVYGRTWGKRRFTARWWGGLRYFEYSGNVLAGAWLDAALPATGYTDGLGFPYLSFFVEADGAGPSGAVEMDFNFFDDRVTLYVLGQAAFVFAKVESTSAPFFTGTLSADDDPLLPYTTVPGQLYESRDKSTWQDSLELGARFRLKNGVQFEAAFSRTGFLDVILLPTEIRIPQSFAEAGQGTSGLFNTQDYVLDAVRFGVSFQF